MMDVADDDYVKHVSTIQFTRLKYIYVIEESHPYMYI